MEKTRVRFEVKGVRDEACGVIGLRAEEVDGRKKRKRREGEQNRLR